MPPTDINEDVDKKPQVEELTAPTESAEALHNFYNNGISNTVPEDSSSAAESDQEGKSEGWYKRYLRWIPSSPFLLEQAEKKVLSYVKTPYEGKFVDITPRPPEPNQAQDQQNKCRWPSILCRNRTPEPIKVWTVEFNNNHKPTPTSSPEKNVNDNNNKAPLVLVHGLCSSVGLWAMNVDELAKDRTVYAIDLIGFGRSSRPQFSSDPAEVEEQHVEAIEEWRKRMGLEKFVLLGHSMGAFISSSYSLKYPERVAHLVLADPWGIPEKPEDIEKAIPVNNSTLLRVVTTLGQKVNPLGLVRAAGPMGPGLIGKARPDLVSKFGALSKDGNFNVAEYIYHCNAQNPTGEEAFRTMMNFFGWAKNPMCHRLGGLDPKVPLTMLYGERTWLQQLPEDDVKNMRPPETHTEVHRIPGAGHHVYADNIGVFNNLVRKAMELADSVFHRD